MRHALSLSAVAVSLACGQAAEKAPLEYNPPQAGVTTKPSSVTLPAAGTAKFAAEVINAIDTSVVWSIQEGAPGGSVSDGGVYVAPAGAGTYHVVATAVADPTKSGSSVVTVLLGVAVNPTTKAMDACTAFTFTATVSGSANQAVTWSIAEGDAGGTITAAGLYTAPRAPGTYHVVATSQADPGQSASAAVTVTSKIISVTVAPATVSLGTGGSQTFTATVVNSCGTFSASQVFTSDDLQKRVRRDTTVAGSK